MIFLDGEKVSLSEAKSQVCHFLATRYPVNVEDSPVAALKEVENIDRFANDFDDEADWYIADFTERPDLGSQVNIRVNSRTSSGGGTVVSESVSSSVAILLSLALLSVNEMSRDSILRVR